MQQVDFTTLLAACHELAQDWVPAKVETVYQFDKHTLGIGLRNLSSRGWLGISWHPEATRIHLTQPPPKVADTFTFSQQLRAQLGGLALVAIAPVAPWERVMDLQFAQRPGDPALFHLFVEVMGKYSNATLTDADRLIISTAHQVSNKQSSVRTVQTGQPYELPPKMLSAAPALTESYEDWQERISLIPGPLIKRAIASYRGLSTALVKELLLAAAIPSDRTTEQLSASDWQGFFGAWQRWLGAIENNLWQPAAISAEIVGPNGNGYSVLGWNAPQTAPSISILLDEYFRDTLGRNGFLALQQQLLQKLKGIIAKLEVKAQAFQKRMAESAAAEESRTQADLLMAHLHLWQQGMTEIILADFETGAPVKISLHPEKSGSQNAQALYRKYQKLKRAQLAVEPLLTAVNEELAYLSQVEIGVSQVEEYQQPSDLETLIEIKDELMQSGYLPPQTNRPKVAQTTQPRSFTSPSGFEVAIGRNNRQNDLLTFKTANDYDLWFHAQEIAGSHGLLRLPAGEVAQQEDLQYMADLMAYHSRGRHSEAIPVVYTAPKHVYKPKGAKPGMVIYKQEKVIWGHPQRIALGNPLTAKSPKPA
jgi:predicted ribosome quality control (RQC) complex YloA/Tae2 family protein